MIYEGARGDTAEEMQHVFMWSEIMDERVPSMVYIQNKINDPKFSCEVHTVNAVWAQKEYPFNEKYLDILKIGYSGEAENVDFGQSETVRNQINEWVEHQTKNKIQELFQKGTIDTNTRMVLVNALYFKGDWAQKFDPDETSYHEFNISKDNQVYVYMMHLPDMRYNYFETDTVQVLEMDYKGGAYSMIILLPEEKAGIDEFENNLDYETYSELVDGLEDRTISIRVPKYKLETKYVLNDGLSDLGMPTAFSGSADFTGMSSNGGIYLGTVVHQAYVEVAELGTEAAAATGGIMTMSYRTSYFTADHPFIITIVEKETGLILFIGIVVDPS